MTPVETDAIEKLSKLGYAVEVEPRIRLGKSTRFALPDLIGWVPTEVGPVQGIVVEVIQPGSPKAKFREAAAQVLKYRSLMPTALSFVFDGEWHRVEPSTGEVCPETPPSAESVVLGESFIKQLPKTPPIAELARRAARATVDSSSTGLGEQELKAAIERFELNRAGAPFASILGELPEGRRAVAREWLKYAEKDAKKGAMVIPWSLARPMARLLFAGRREDATEVLDPNCGRGSMLLAVAEELGDSDNKPLLAGMSMVHSDVDFTETLLSFAGGSATAKPGNIFDGPTERLWANIIALPPLGYRRTSGPSLDSLGLLNIANSLEKGGRAVVAVASGVLFRGGKDEQVRAQLLADFRVSAVISLPGNILLNTGLPMNLLVIERRKPGDTLVAELDHDWEEQLSGDGDFFREYARTVGRAQ